MQLSVVICTHNPRLDYLQRTLAAIQEQDLPYTEWEFCIVDNCSKVPVEEQVDLSWHPNAKIIREVRPGLTAARLCGIRETAGEMIVFFDDDNIPVKTYLSDAKAILEAKPKIGLVGAGEIKPEFEEEPASDLLPFTRFLALRTVPEDIVNNNANRGKLPFGAGIVVRRSVAINYAQKVDESPDRQKLGRNGKNLLSCEDDEFAWVATRMEYQYGLFTRLSIIHLIPSFRVQRDYLTRIIHGNGYSSAVLAYLNGQKRGKSFVTPRFTHVCKALLALKPRTTVKTLNEWIEFLGCSKTERAMRRARERGWLEATIELDLK